MPGETALGRRHRHVQHDRFAGAMSLLGQVGCMAGVGKDRQRDRPRQLQHAAVACRVLPEVVDYQGQPRTRDMVRRGCGLAGIQRLAGEQHQQRQPCYPA